MLTDPHTLHTLLDAAKWSFSTRRIRGADVTGLSSDVDKSKSGDLILGRVVSIGQHTRIQLSSGRPAALYTGDLIVMPCGARYAPDQFEGFAEIGVDSCDMLAGGGCLGRMVARNERIKPATTVQPLGRLRFANGKVANTDSHSLPSARGKVSIPVIAVVGTSMNSGKTTATTALTHGLTRVGWRVAALKGTGTGSFGDFNDYVDAGAHYVADFTDAGMVTTYREPLDRIKKGIADILWSAEETGAEIVLMELADGIFQLETAALLQDEAFRQTFAGVIFACGDAVAAAGGVSALAAMNIKPMLLTGLLSTSPMASAEAEKATGIRVVSRGQLLDPAHANLIAAQVNAQVMERVAA